MATKNMARILECDLDDAPVTRGTFFGDDARHTRRGTPFFFVVTKCPILFFAQMLISLAD